MNKKSVGFWGEKIAQDYLISKGYKILATNWRYHHKEIDIIAYKRMVVGLEVKTRRTKTQPFTILKSQQVARIRLTLRAYCHLNCLNYNKTRIDLISIIPKDKNTIILKHNLDI